MFDKLKAVEERYDKLMALVSDAAIQANTSEYRNTREGPVRDSAVGRKVS